MADTGSGPNWTYPLLGSDEYIAIHAMGDYMTLCPQSSVMAAAADGAFASGAPWVLTSATVDFQQQGVVPQCVVVLTLPRPNFPGGGHLLAVDSVAGNSCTLRRVGQPLGIGQPPAPSTGLSGVTFEIRTLKPQIDEASYRIKSRFTIDEQIPYRTSDWIYRGAEDPYRVLRDVVVFTVLADCYESQTRDQTENGDFARKAKRYRFRLEEALAQAQVRWGPFGNSSPPSSLMGCKLSR
jgi:hypothetical protein